MRPAIRAFCEGLAAFLRATPCAAGECAEASAALVAHWRQFSREPARRTSCCIRGSVTASLRVPGTRKGNTGSGEGATDSVVTATGSHTIAFLSVTPRLHVLVDVTWNVNAPEWGVAPSESAAPAWIHVLRGDAARLLTAAISVTMPRGVRFDALASVGD